MEYITAVTEMEYKLEFEPTKYIPYLTLMGELWDVFCKDFEETWSRYNGTALFWVSFVSTNSNLYSTLVIFVLHALLW